MMAEKRIELRGIDQGSDLPARFCTHGVRHCSGLLGARKSPVAGGGGRQARPHLGSAQDCGHILGPSLGPLRELAELHTFVCANRRSEHLPLCTLASPLPSLKI